MSLESSFGSPRVGNEASPPLSPHTRSSRIPPSVRTPHRAWQFRCDLEEFETEKLPLVPESSKAIRSPDPFGKLEQGSMAGLLDFDMEEEGLLPFVDQPWFQNSMGAVIFMNCIMIGLETDRENTLLSTTENVLLVVFVLELVARWCHMGSHFPCRAGNMVDILVVSSSLLDMWILPATSGETSKTSDAAVLLGVIRMMRLLRIFRLVRLVKVVKPLHRLALGLVEAMSGMFWVLIFLFIVLYAVAVICTRLIGHANVGDPMGDPSEQKVYELINMFSSVFASMFVLFETMSCWSLMPFTDLFSQMPMLRICAVMFYVIVAWALLAVMTGVVSEKMLAVAEHVAQDEFHATHGDVAVKDFLRDLFTKADTDGSGMLSQDELDTMLGVPEIVKQLHDRFLVNGEDLNDLFAFCDRDGSGEIPIEEFVNSLCDFMADVSPKMFIQLQEDMVFEVGRIRTQILGMINARFDTFIKLVQSPTRKIIAVTEQIQRISDTLNYEPLIEEVGRRITRQELYEMEDRLRKRIDAVGKCVDRLHKLHRTGKVKLERVPAESTLPDLITF